MLCCAVSAWQDLLSCGPSPSPPCLPQALEEAIVWNLRYRAAFGVLDLLPDPAAFSNLRRLEVHVHGVRDAAWLRRLSCLSRLQDLALSSFYLPGTKAGALSLAALKRLKLDNSDDGPGGPPSRIGLLNCPALETPRLIDNFDFDEPISAPRLTELELEWFH